MGQEEDRSDQPSAEGKNETPPAQDKREAQPAEDTVTESPALDSAPTKSWEDLSLVGDNLDWTCSTSTVQSKTFPNLIDESVLSAGALGGWKSMSEVLPLDEALGCYFQQGIVPTSSSDLESLQTSMIKWLQQLVQTPGETFSPDWDKASKAYQTMFASATSLQTKLQSLIQRQNAGQRAAKSTYAQVAAEMKGKYQAEKTLNERQEALCKWLIKNHAEMQAQLDKQETEHAKIRDEFTNELKSMVFAAYESFAAKGSSGKPAAEHMAEDAMMAELESKLQEILIAEQPDETKVAPPANSKPDSPKEPVPVSTSDTSNKEVGPEAGQGVFSCVILIYVFITCTGKKQQKIKKKKKKTILPVLSLPGTSSPSGEGPRPAGTQDRCADIGCERRAGVSPEGHQSNRGLKQTWKT